MDKFEELNAANPFPGLRSFMPGEADRFFGREEQIDALVALLDETPLVAVAGASGCGKSSLVLAGVLSRLRDRGSGTNIEWRAARLRPGNRPIPNLAAGLAEALDGADTADENRLASLEGRLRLGGRGLAEIVRLVGLQARTRVLVVVDQFEEIFRFRRMTDPEEAAAFVKLLLAAATDPDARVSVMFTLRSDALGNCPDFPDLPEAINRGQYLVPKLTRDQRKDAIVKPVQLRGFQIAPRLVQRILNDLTSDFDDLPIMQHVLTRTWRKWAAACQGTRWIDLEDYQATGTAANALSDHANEAFASLTGLEKTVERAFRALTERTAEGAAIRRPLNFDRLCAVVGGDRGNVEKVVERFRQTDTAFLLPSQEKPLKENPVIDISHESLIRQWPRLLDWTQTEVESKNELIALINAAHRFEQKEGDLLRGRDLERIREWQTREKPTEGWVGLCTERDGKTQWQSAQAFLGLSEELAKSEQRQRRNKWFKTGAATVLLAALVGLFVAVIQHRPVESRLLSSEAMLELNQDPALSAHRALVAIDWDPSNSEAELALNQSLAILDTARTERILSMGEPIGDVRLTKDKSELVVAGEKSVRILDAQSFKLLFGPFPRDEQVSKAWLIADNSLLVTFVEGGRAQIQNIHGGSIASLSCSQIWALAIGEDERQIATGCQDGKIEVCAVSDGEVQPCQSLARGGSDKYAITALSFSSDNKYLASGDFDGTVNIWKLGTPGPWVGAGNQKTESPISHHGTIRDIAFYPDNPEVLATASDDGTAIVWHLDLPHRQLAQKEEADPPYGSPMEHGHPVISARFATWDENVMSLMTIAGKQVSFWKSIKDANTRSHTDRITRSHDNFVNDAELSDNNKWLVTASDDTTARVWSTRNGLPTAVLRGHRGAVIRALFTADNKIITAGADGYLRVWRFNPPALLASYDAWMLAAAFDPSGRRVAVCGEALKEDDESQCRIIDLQRKGASEVLDGVHNDEGNFDEVYFISWNKNGELLLGNAASEGIVQGSLSPTLWDVKSGHVITPDWFHDRMGAFFWTTADELVTIEGDGSIAVWNATAVEEKNPKPKFHVKPRSSVLQIALSPDGRWVAAIENNIVELVDATKLEAAPLIFAGHRGAIVSAQFSPDSKELVTASTDSTARIWKIDGGRDQLLRGEAAFSYAAFSHDGRLVVTGSVDGMIRVWDAHNGLELTACRLHDQVINEVHFGGDDQTILAASDDGTVTFDRCEAHDQTGMNLRQIVKDEAILPGDESAEIAQENRAMASYANLWDFRMAALATIAARSD
jgi:WD40 repeat protein